jgi:hypothetical protein
MRATKGFAMRATPSRPAQASSSHRTLNPKPQPLNPYSRNNLIIAEDANPYTLHPTPHTLNNLIIAALNPTPYTLHPTP